MDIGYIDVGGVKVGRLRRTERERLLAAAQEADLTYGHSGSTLAADHGAAPAVRMRDLVVGRGPEAFAAGREGLRGWVPQRGIGATVTPADQGVDNGATVLLLLRRGPFHVVAPVRVVAVVDEPQRFAYAYGTLPGHPERGEESFAVELLPDGAVRATIRVAAGPATWAGRVASPILRGLQLAALNGYLRALATHVAGETPPPGASTDDG